MKYLKAYLYNVFLSLDQTFNVVVLFGDPDVSVSSHIALAQHLEDSGKGKARWFVRPLGKLIDTLFDNRFYSIEKDHIKNAFEKDECNHRAIWKWYKVNP